ncbi:MAG: chemotaxis protein CheW [Campylobacterota bacterium]|nr:chemotaxis protein CheW [Campylobacterota bacterium]
MAIPNNILSVKIGKELFAFDGEDIEQILRVPEVTAMPLTCDGIRGVSSISGRTVTVVDMATILSSGSIDEKKTDARILTVKCDDVEYGILVDEVLEMESVDNENYEESDKEDVKISGLYKKDEKIIQIIDTCVAIHSLSLISYAPLELDKFGSSDNNSDDDNARGDDDSQRSIFLTLGKESFAISLEIAREIIFVPENITPVSEAGYGVMGMITLRDELIVALDLKQVISVPAREDMKEWEEKEKRLLILNYDGKSVALLVDSITEVKDILKNQTETLPERFADSKVESVYKQEDKIISIVSTQYLKDMASEYVIEDDKNTANTNADDEDMSGDDKDMNEIAAFQIKGEEFALDIQDVQEIIKYTEITAIPEAPSFVDGVINLRGVVIPIVSLPERLGFQKEITPKSKILICDIKGEKIGLFVDDVNEVMFIDNANTSQSNSDDSLFSEVITLDDGKRTILKLRITEVLDDNTIESIKMIDKN